MPRHLFFPSVVISKRRCYHSDATVGRRMVGRNIAFQYWVVPLQLRHCYSGMRYFFLYFFRNHLTPCHVLLMICALKFSDLSKNSCTSGTAVWFCPAIVWPFSNMSQCSKNLPKVTVLKNFPMVTVQKNASDSHRSEKPPDGHRSENLPIVSIQEFPDGHFPWKPLCSLCSGKHPGSGKPRDGTSQVFPIPLFRKAQGYLILKASGDRH